MSCYSQPAGEPNRNVRETFWMHAHTSFFIGVLWLANWTKICSALPWQFLNKILCQGQMRLLNAKQHTIVIDTYFNVYTLGSSLAEWAQNTVSQSYLNNFASLPTMQLSMINGKCLPRGQSCPCSHLAEECIPVPLSPAHPRHKG